MEPIIISIPGEKVQQKAKETALLDSCKFYKGEEDCPFKPKYGDNRAAVWYCEQSWAQDMEQIGEDAFKHDLEDYKGYDVGKGLPDDGRPETLKARIFERYAKGAYSMADAASEFLDFYTEVYGEPSGA